MPEYTTIDKEITRISNNIADSYDIAESLGAVVPLVKNSDNLASTLNTIDDHSVPRISINCAGLCLWLDGECNTRQGLDRSKKYTEIWY